MGNNKNLSDFTAKTKKQMEDVIGSEEYTKPIANTLGPKKCLESFKKFMNPKNAIKAITRVVKGVNIGPIGIQFRNPDEMEKNNKLESEPER